MSITTGNRLPRPDDRARSRIRRIIAVLSVVAASAALVVVVVPTAAGAVGEHCSVTVTGQKKSGELVTTPVTCGTSTTFGILSVIAIHYTDVNFGGTSLSIQGGPCNGGWLNLPAGWTNTVSSTWSVCSTQHYDLDSLAGEVETLNPGGGNLTSLHDRANSVRYT